jgi:hypothetical protein
MKNLEHFVRICEEIDIRILVYALPEHSKGGAGFADAISLEEA